MLLALSTLALPCEWYIYDDYGDGSADGVVYGGTFVEGGWRPDGGTIVYDLPETVVSATITFRLSNVDERGVSQHDLIELFSEPDGDFQDGRRDNFLQVKLAGDIYDGYDGRVKLQAGPELYGDGECGSWTAEYDWDPARSYDVTLAWDATSARLDVGGEVSASIDATPCDDIGPLGFRSVVVPNDGSYARDPLMDDMVIAGVSLCGDAAEADTDTDADSDTDTDADSDTDTDADSDTDTDADAEVAAPVVAAFSVDPADVTEGERWVVGWAVEGDVDDLRFCFREADAALETCAALATGSGRMPVPTDGLAAGAYDGTLVVTGPGGTTSSSLALSVAARPEATDAGGCATATAPGWLAVLGTAAALGRRARR